MSKPLKILWLASWYPDKYQGQNGDFVERHALALAQLMPIDVIHVVQAGKDVATTKEATVTTTENLTEYIHAFDYTPSGNSFIDSYRYNFKFIATYKSLLKQYIQQNGKPDIVHVHVPMKAGLLALWLKKKYNIPFVVTEHSSMYNPVAKDSFYTRSLFFRHNTTQIFKQATAVTCVSKNIGNMLQQLFTLPAVDVVHNVVNENHFYYLPKANKDCFTFIHVSSLYALKNVDKIIEAFYMLNFHYTNWQLKIVGPRKEALAALVEEYQLTDKIIFLNELPYAAVATEMQAADALVLFSKHENFPCVIIEALCCGLPIISSDVGGVAEAVNASNGVLIPEGNVEYLAVSLHNLMMQYATYNRQQIAADAQKKYNQQNIAEQFLEVYSKVMI